jgi:hypothetical protein
VSSGRGKLDGAPGALLASYVCEVGLARLWSARWRADGLRLEASAEVCTRFRQVPNGDRLDPGERGFPGRLGGTEKSAQPGAPRRLGRDERAGNGANPTVERELPDGGVLCEPLGRDLARRRQDSEGDGKVEARPLLPEPGGREVHGDAAKRPLELGARNSAPNALLRLLTGLVREPDDREAGNAALEVRLDLDRTCL